MDDALLPSFHSKEEQRSSMGKTKRSNSEREAFAKRLRQARISAGHDTMEAAARAIGIRSGVYWRHENGKQGITLEFVRLYARAFGVPAGWLAFGNQR